VYVEVTRLPSHWPWQGGFHTKQHFIFIVVPAKATHRAVLFPPRLFLEGNPLMTRRVHTWAHRSIATMRAVSAPLPTNARVRRLVDGARSHSLRTRSIACTFVCLLILSSLAPSGVEAQADARQQLLLRALATSPSFRVRAQAAVALSHLPPAPRVLAALKLSLADSHASVREASAAALASLEEASPRDPTPQRNSAKYYVHVAVPSGNTSMSAIGMKAMREHLVAQVSKIDGVRLASENENEATVTRLLKRELLVGYSVQSVLNTLERRGDSVRASVTLLVVTYPGRDIRATLSASASVAGRGTDDAAQRQAAEVAFGSALRKLPGLLETLSASAVSTTRRYPG